MEWVRFDDWVQWGVLCSTAQCDDSVRDRFQRFVQRHIFYCVGAMPEEQRSRLREYLEDNADSRRRCATVFDSYMLRGRKKVALLACTPRRSNANQEDYAAAWSAYTKACIRSLVREELRKEITDAPPDILPPESLDKSLGTDIADGGLTRGDTLEAGGPTVHDEIALREVEALSRTIFLDDRERLVLWADQHSEPRCSERMQKLAGCGRDRLSACALKLEERLNTEVASLFQLQPHEAEQAKPWAAWAWQTLAFTFQNIFPERDATGDLIWKSPPN